MDKKTCLACEVNVGKITTPGGLIHRDELWVVDHAVGRNPDDPIPLKGFLIICPVRHVEHIHLLTDEEQLNFGLLLLDVTNALVKVLKPEKIHIHSMGEDVKHVHWYVVPRMAGMPENGLDFLVEVIRGRRWACSIKDASTTALKVKAELEQLVASRGGTSSTPYSHLL